MGTSEEGLGGWALEVSFPTPSEIVAVGLEAMSNGIPSETELRRREVGSQAGDFRISDANIPESWNQPSEWPDLFTRAHSYAEAIHLYEGRVLIRGLEIVCKILVARRAWFVSLEDNAVVVHSLAKGRSQNWSVNTICRRRAALELCSDVALLATWIGTERMPMDQLSRKRVLNRTSVQRTGARYL